MLETTVREVKETGGLNPHYGFHNRDEQSLRDGASWESSFAGGRWCGDGMFYGHADSHHRGRSSTGAHSVLGKKKATRGHDHTQRNPLKTSALNWKSEIRGGRL
jgi:hypothetical protein